MPCCNCGALPPNQAAHSNYGKHGKGMGIKASDAFTIPLCHKCHIKLDQYQNKKEFSEIWFDEKLIFVNGVLNEKEPSIF